MTTPHKATRGSQIKLLKGDIPKPDLDWIFDKLPSKGLAVITVADGPEKAAQIWQRYM